MNNMGRGFPGCAVEIVSPDLEVVSKNLYGAVLKLRFLGLQHQGYDAQDPTDKDKQLPMESF